MRLEPFQFAETLPRSAKHDEFISQLATPLWRIALAALYLSSGRLLPDEAKKRGAFFGFCDAQGNRCRRDQATHVGWSVVPPDASKEQASEG